MTKPAKKPSKTISTNFRIDRKRHARLARLSRVSKLSMTELVERAIDEAVAAWRKRAAEVAK